MGSRSQGLGAGVWRVGASALLDSDQSRGSKLLTGTKRSGGGVFEGIPRMESEGRGLSQQKGRADERAPNPALPTPLCGRYLLLPTLQMRLREVK